MMAAARWLAAACGGGDPGREWTAATGSFSVLAGGNNVPERYSSDLGCTARGPIPAPGAARRATASSATFSKIWSLGAAGAPTLADSIKSRDRHRERRPGERRRHGAGVQHGARRRTRALRLRADRPPRPDFPGQRARDSGHPHRHDRGYRRPGGTCSPPAPEGSRPPGVRHHRSWVHRAAGHGAVAANYGIHDTYVRDGLAFVFAWNTGVIIYDVGNGIRGGRRRPHGGEPAAHGGQRVAGRIGGTQRWWFHNPVRRENRYLFIGQEGPSSSARPRAGHPRGGRARSPEPRRSPSSTWTEPGPTTSGWTSRARSSHGLLQQRRRGARCLRHAEGRPLRPMIAQIRPGRDGDT